jgi:predicted MFS family arabinose efflux permease
VVGVILGGVIADHWGWKAAFGVVGFPGLALALLYLLVRDYRTVELEPRREQARRSTRDASGFIVRALVRSRTTLWICIGAPMQLIAVSALWSWLPSFLNRVHGMTPQAASIKAAMVVLAGALGSVIWGAVVDRAGRERPGVKLQVVAVLCLATLAVLGFAFGAPRLGIALAQPTQFVLILLGGFLMTCTVGPAAAVVIDVTHPGVRSTGASVLSLFQNLFGLAVGPIVAGALSDLFDLETALAITPLFALLAAAAMLMAARTYAGDKSKVAAVQVEAASPAAAVRAPVAAE